MPVRFKCPVCGVVKLMFRSEAIKRKACSRECAASLIRTHGQSYTRLHQTWCSMKRRCHGRWAASATNSLVHEYYIARGIIVCQEWRTSFEAFRDWALASGYTDELELDRINGDGNYEPSNCRWATRSQQMANTRKRRNAKTSKYRGVSRHSQNDSWVAQGHANKKTFNLGSFATEADAALAYNEWASATFGEFASLNTIPSTEGAQ